MNRITHALTQTSTSFTKEMNNYMHVNLELNEYGIPVDARRIRRKTKTMRGIDKRLSSLAIFDYLVLEVKDVV